MADPLSARSSMTGIDSPRWCGHCQTWGDHHTDRCRQTTVRTDHLPHCERCRKPYGDAIPTPSPDGLCGQCRHNIMAEGAERALTAWRRSRG